MKKQTVKTTTITPEKEAEFVHYSDGSELIPSEVQSKFQSNENFASGYTKDDEGIINNYALEPDTSSATYPDSKQQLRYIFLGASAIMFVAALLIVTFAVS